MIAAAGGCTLSQDRISYYQFEESGAETPHNRIGYLNDPRGDLAHFGTYSGEIPLILNWIYNYTGSPFSSDSAYLAKYRPDIFDDGDTSDMDSIREFIDDDRPVVRGSRKHGTLITGYAIIREMDGVESDWLLVQDPARSRPNLWCSLDSTKDKYYNFAFPPKTGHPMRNDEPEMDVDTDRDGLCDFDELRRFGTLPGDVDTDGDGVRDMQDIVGYVFERDGRWLSVDPDIDSDGARKESDPDNDRPLNDGETDGCEDADHDGFWTPGGTESSCFVGLDDFTVSNPDCFSGFIRYHTSTDLCVGTFVDLEEIILREGVLASSGFVHEMRWIHNLVMAVCTPGSEHIWQRGHSEGSGSARVELVPDSTGRYSIVIETQPTEAPMEVKYDLMGSTWTQTEMVPIFLNLVELSADRVGVPEKTEDGGVVLRGTWDLLADEPPVEGIDRSATLSWDIWLLKPGPAADLSRNRIVDYLDIEILSNEWLSSGTELAADLYEDDTVDLKDYAELADAWLEEQLWPEP